MLTVCEFLIFHLYFIIINTSLHASLAALITHLYQILTGIFFAPVIWLEGGRAGLNILWVNYCFTIKFSDSRMLVSATSVVANNAYTNYGDSDSFVII